MWPGPPLAPLPGGAAMQSRTVPSVRRFVLGTVDVPHTPAAQAPKVYVAVHCAHASSETQSA